MSLLGSIIKVGGSLLGGLLGKKSARSAEDRQNEYNKPINVRARAEEGGFNPLNFVGPGVGNQMAPGASGHMGAAIADSSMMIADKLSSQAEEKARLTNLELQNERLQKEINNMTLRPKTSGIYGSVVSNSPRPAWEESELETARPPRRGYGDITNAIDERPYVNLFNSSANSWVKMHPGDAERLELKDGDNTIVEDTEALQGEIPAEVQGLGNAAANLFGFGRTYSYGDGFNRRHGSGVPKLPKVSYGPPSAYQKRPPLRLKFTGP